jgi:hypothetical protein
MHAPKPRDSARSGGAAIICCGLQGEESAFVLGAAEVAAESSVGAHHAVTGDDDGQRVGRARGADRAYCLGIAGEFRDGRVAGGVAVSDAGEVAEHGVAKTGRECPVDGQVEGVAASVLVGSRRGVGGPGLRDAGTMRWARFWRTASWFSFEGHARALIGSGGSKVPTGLSIVQ